MPQIAPNCLVQTSGHIHESVVIHPFTQIAGDVSIGENTVIGSHVNILGNKKPVKIGKNVRIQSNVFIPDGTVIEDDVFIGPNVCFLNDKYPPSHGKAWMPATVKKGAALGGSVTILPGVVIGENARIGAGAVVTKDILAGALAFGNPAQMRGIPHEGSEWGFYKDANNQRQ